MGRKCSHCGHNGHNSRTCNNSRSDCGVKLFGVQLQVASSSMKKCLSMECLYPPSIPPSCSSSSPSSSTSSTSSLVSRCENNGKLCNGYLSDGPMGRQADRKKGIPWSEEEHRVFLDGLEKLGKGDWRGISRSFVTTRTPTQVASHAQKYFLRQNSHGKKKRRSSLFDAIEGFGQGCYATELPFSSDIHVTSLPLNSKPQGVNEKVMIDRNINGQGADQQHSCLNLMSVCPSIMSSGLPSKLSSGVEELHVTNHQLPDLELKISS